MRVALTQSGLLQVINDGPVLAPDTLARLTARFERGQDTGSDGSGLGLSIVQAIADGAEATLSLQSPATGRPDGFEVRFQLTQSDFPE